MSEFFHVNRAQRLDNFTSGEVEILSSSATWTAKRDVKPGVRFTDVVLYDGQGFITRKDAGIASIEDLAVKRKSICSLGETTSLDNLREIVKERNWPSDLKVLSASSSLRASFYSGSCDLATADRTMLLSLKSNALVPEHYQILPEVISKEPLALVVPEGDEQWLDIVRWAFYSMLLAEELGVGSLNIDEFKQSNDPAIQRLIGIDKSIGYGLGLDADWVYQAVSQVGNYAEIYERNLGQESELKLDRGLNRLWRDGGLLYAPNM